jgi:hypothetical protein
MQFTLSSYPSQRMGSVQGEKYFLILGQLFFPLSRFNGKQIGWRGHVSVSESSLSVNDLDIHQELLWKRNCFNWTGVWKTSFCLFNRRITERFGTSSFCLSLIEATETAFWLLSFWSLSGCALCFIRPGLQELDHGLESRQSSWCFNPGERLLVLTVQFSQSTISANLIDNFLRKLGSEGKPASL